MRSNAYGGGSSPSITHQPEAGLPQWKLKAIESVGRVIAFWGFKENHGRIWAYLYLKNQPATASEIQMTLNLSKGATSMLLQDLETWNILLRDEKKPSRKRQYRANEQLMHMISQVFQNRESGLIQRTIDDLKEAEELAILSNVDATTLQRLKRMKKLAELMNHVLRFVSLASNLDIQQIISFFPLSSGQQK